MIEPWEVLSSRIVLEDQWIEYAPIIAVATME